MGKHRASGPVRHEALDDDDDVLPQPWYRNPVTLSASVALVSAVVFTVGIAKSCEGSAPLPVAAATPSPQELEQKALFAGLANPDILGKWVLCEMELTAQSNIYQSVGNRAGADAYRAAAALARQAGIPCTKPDSSPQDRIVAIGEDHVMDYEAIPNLEPLEYPYWDGLCKSTEQKRLEQTLRWPGLDPAQQQLAAAVIRETGHVLQMTNKGNC